MSTLKGGISQRFARMMRMNNSDDPLSSLQAVTRWAENLPVGDALKAHNEILNEVKRFNEDQTPPDKERLLILMLLDEKSRDTQAVLARQYLRNPRMSRNLESQLWHAMFLLTWEILRGYHSFLIDYAREPAKSKLKAMMPVVTMRAIRGFGEIIKWRSIRYLPPGPKTWLRLHQLYQLAETQGFHQTRLLAYPNDPHESTCELEYVHALILDQANSGSLYPRQIDLIDTWIGGWHDKLSLKKQPESGHSMLAVDLSKDRGAKRTNGELTELSLRYWSPAPLLFKIKQTQTELHNGLPPARLGLTEFVHVSEALELLDYLSRQWSLPSSRENRRAPRRAMKKVVEIVHGLLPVISQIKEARSNARADAAGAAEQPMNPAGQAEGFVTKRSFDPEIPVPPKKSEKKNNIERWVMEDGNELGYGTTIETRDRDWLRVGALVGARTDKNYPWTLGVVRRMARLNEHESSVGIELLPGKLLDIFLLNPQSPGYVVESMDGERGLAAMSGLLIEDSDTLVLDPANYQRGAKLSYSHQHEKRDIKLLEPVDHGQGWIRVRFSYLD